MLHCHDIFMIVGTGPGLFATNILVHLAYVMYHYYHLKSEISSKHKNFCLDVTPFMLLLYSSYFSFL